MTSPVRYSKGITNVGSSAVFGQIGMPDPTKYHVFFDDFHSMDWSVWHGLYTASSLLSVVTQDSDDGRLLITLPATEDTYCILQYHPDAAGEVFKLESGKKLWFKTKFKINDADQTDVAVGLMSLTTSSSAPFAAGAANGVYFASDDGDLYVDVYMRSGSATISSDTVITSLADSTDITLGFYFDGISKVTHFIGETNESGDIDSTSFPTTELLPVIAFRNGEATANTLDIDYICCIKER